MQSSEHNTAAKRARIPAEVARRFDEFDAAVETVEQQFADDQFSAAFGKFREAINLSHGFPSLQERVGILALEQAKRLLPQDWHIARSLLLEADEAGCLLPKPKELLRMIEEQEREANILNFLNAASLASSVGDASLARRRLEVVNAQYPGDSRILAQLTAVAASSAVTHWRETLAEAGKEARDADATRLLARATWAKAREFQRAGFYADALEQWTELQSIDPQYPGLANELACCRSLAKPPEAHSPDPQPLALIRLDPARELQRYHQPAAKPWSVPSEATWNRVKTAATLVFATASLAIAGVLIYTHSPIFTAARLNKVSINAAGAKRAQAAQLPSLPESGAQILPSVIVLPSPKVALPHPPIVTVVARSGAISGASPGESANPETLPPVVHQASATLPPPPAEPTLAQAPISLPAALPLSDLESKHKAEFEAWSAVDRSDAHSLEAYLSRFPDGANRSLAEQSLTDIRQTEAAQLRSQEVLQAVQQYADAWTARDINSILSLQSNLDRKSLKTQLSGVKSIVMNIAPLGEPSIAGDQATLPCHRQVLQVFKDGVVKQTPEQTVTLLLTKRNGAWTIDGTRE